MRWPKSIICVWLLVIYSLTIWAQRHDCRRLRERCAPCARRLTDPENNLEYVNLGCRAFAGNNGWIWRDVSRCDMQILACENHDKRLNCDTVAALAGMKRRPRPT